MMGWVKLNVDVHDWYLLKVLLFELPTRRSRVKGIKVALQRWKSKKVYM